MAVDFARTDPCMSTSFLARRAPLADAQAQQPGRRQQ
jgi:hypothetical protein